VSSSQVIAQDQALWVVSQALTAHLGLRYTGLVRREKLLL